MDNNPLSSSLTVISPMGILESIIILWSDGKLPRTLTIVSKTWKADSP